MLQRAVILAVVFKCVLFTDYIFTIGKRYSNDICSVDVVNECISDKKFVLRDEEDHSKWLKFLGPDYVDKVFVWAKEAFPKSNLVINDYNLEIIPEKRQGLYNLVRCTSFI